MWISTSKIFYNKIACEPVGQVQYVVFKKFTSSLLHQIAREIMLLLAKNVHEKTSQQVKTQNNLF